MKPTIVLAWRTQVLSDANVDWDNSQSSSRCHQLHSSRQHVSKLPAKPAKIDKYSSGQCSKNSLPRPIRNMESSPRFTLFDDISTSSRCRNVHPSNSGQNWIGEMVPSPYNIFIELILPCIIFRERVGPAGRPKYGAGTNLVHYLYMLYIRAALKDISNCRKNR